MFWNLLITGLALNIVHSRVVLDEISHCSSSEFSCPDGKCVSLRRVCDGTADCVDGFDEDACRPGAKSSLALGDIVSRVKRQSQCRKSEWPCRDGSCVPFYAKCDGIVDCPDRSDESHALCRNSVCQDNLFRCTYGACVDGTAACNGIQECADNSDELQPQCHNVTRVVRGRFKCDNGQEISAVELCDGELNCDDGSDEKIEVCAGKTCPNYLFQCAYGACVDGLSDCNGKQECADGSDESDELCNRTSTVVTPSPITTTTSISWGTGSCLLPPYPANGRYEVLGTPSAKPGQPFTSVKYLTVSCDPGYAVNGNDSSLILCLPGTDLANDVPKCQRYCELNEHHSVVYECETRSAEGTLRRPCTKKEFVGTTVIPTCRTPNYRGNPGYMHCTEKGWDFVAKCAPECGRATPFGQEYVINGTRAKHGELPWHAGIYSRMYNPIMQICGGSLVSTNAVISAAHCFWKDGVGLQSADIYTVALGKIFRPYNDTHDKNAQFSDIEKIHIPAQFHGTETNFQSDIAIVILKKEIVFKTFIRPVCVSFDQAMFNRQVQPGKLGKIAGWGLTSANGKSAPVLQVVELPYVSYDQCYEESPQDFREYITVDKICAGYRNGTALCQGDSGGGLAFADDEGGNLRYYLRGIVSTAPRNDQVCDPFQRTTFTNLLYHDYFIRNAVYIEGL